MKTVRIHVVWLVVVLGVLALAASLLLPARAAAQLGNAGVPVRCFVPSGSEPNPGGSAFLNCVSADDTPFVDGQRVPENNYLLVTDVFITPKAGSNTNGITSISIFDAYGSGSRQSSFRMRGPNSAQVEMHWASPYLVLRPGHRLEVVLDAASAYGVEVRASGLLVTNLAYLPLAVR